MALGTAITIKRCWSLFTQSAGHAKDWMRTQYEEWNDMCDALAVIETLVNELRTDHATMVTFLDELDTDSGTIATFQTEAKTDIGTIATWEAEVDSDLDDINDFIDYLIPDGIYSGDPGVVEGSSDTTKLKLAGTTIRYMIGGRHYVSFAAKETEPPTGEITENLFGAYRMDLNASGTLTVTRKADPMAYASLEDALLSLGSVTRTANSIDVGYLVIEAAAGGFTAQTDLPKTADAQVTAATYYDVHVARNRNGLNTAATVAVANGVGTLNISAIDADANGVKLSQIAAAGTQAMDDADTVASTKWGGWLLVVDPAGTGTYALAADGIAGTVSAMSYASQAAVDTALDTVQAAIPAFCVPIARIYLNNVGGGDAWTAGTDNWDHDTAVASATVYPVINSRVAADTYSIIPPTIPGSVTAPAVAAMSSTAVAQVGATNVGSITAAAADLSGVSKMSTTESQD